MATGKVWLPVLDFWFMPAGTPGHNAPRREWFRKDAAFDTEIRSRFGTLIEEALSGGLRDWDAHPRGALARILLLDQFTRNAFRDAPQAFVGDTLALEAARVLAASGADLALAPVQRLFVYLPFEHAEDMAMQDQSVALFRQLHEETGDFAEALDDALRHREVVVRFGRFPHRNAILGRASTPEEVAFLKEPGSRF